MAHCSKPLSVASSVSQIVHIDSEDDASGCNGNTSSKNHLNVASLAMTEFAYTQGMLKEEFLDAFLCLWKVEFMINILFVVKTVRCEYDPEQCKGDVSSGSSLKNAGENVVASCTVEFVFYNEVIAAQVQIKKMQKFKKL
ncbi:hypothetical protein ACOSQ4_028408 [Xanthoceras sorbifolium]